MILFKITYIIFVICIKNIFLFYILYIIFIPEKIIKSIFKLFLNYIKFLNLNIYLKKLYKINYFMY